MYRLPLLPTLGATRQRHSIISTADTTVTSLLRAFHSIRPHGGSVTPFEELLHGVEGPPPAALAPQHVRVVPADRLGQPADRDTAGREQRGYGASV